MTTAAFSHTRADRVPHTPTVHIDSSSPRTAAKAEASRTHAVAHPGRNLLGGVRQSIFTPCVEVGPQVHQFWIWNTSGVPMKGPYFPDGSANNPSRKELRAAAWAVVQINAMGNATYTRTGLVPSDWGFGGTAFEGELYAVIKAAEHSQGLFILYTDNQAVWQGCQCEHHLMCQDNSRHKHLWHRLAAALTHRPCPEVRRTLFLSQM
eukprot:780524-Amphidinium_carterae.1